MNNKYTYPIRKIFKKIIRFELIFWGILILVALAIRLLDFKKSWIKPYLSDSLISSSKPALEKYLTQESQFTFLHLGFAVFLFLIPIYFFGEYWYMQWKNRKMEQFGNTTILENMFQPIQEKYIIRKLFFFRNFIFFITLALMQPVFGKSKVTTNSKNVELIVALDISNSMNVKDISLESRLTIAKRSLVQLINTLRGERIGICVFAGKAYVQLPLTADYIAAKMYVNEIETSMLSQQGTNIGEALGVSSQMFSKAKVGKQILLVTDGENLDGNLEENVQYIRENDIQVAVLGIGTKNGGYIPNNPFKPEFGYKIMEDGKKVISKINPKLIEDIAQKTAGFAAITSSSFPNLEKIIKHIRAIKSENSKEKTTLEVKENRYQEMLVIALLFLVLFFYASTLTYKKEQQI
jgi:Ca-activated chloride channel family protein